MKFNLLILLMLTSIIGCKKSKQSIDGQWNLKAYSVSYFDVAANKIFESKPDELLQFSKIQIANDSIGIFSESAIVTSQTLIKTNPADLLHLSVQKSQNTVAIKFGTTNEVNTKETEIQRSSDVRTFKTIGIIMTRNVSGVHNYSFLDISPSFGTNYYRLKLVDNDGSSTYSNIVSITINQSFIKNGNEFYFPVNLIDDTFKNIKVKFSGERKMFWNDEASNVQYVENGVTKPAAKAKLQMEFDKN